MPIPVLCSGPPVTTVRSIQHSVHVGLKPVRGLLAHADGWTMEGSERVPKTEIPDSHLHCS